MLNPITIQLFFEKDTKNTYRYLSADEDSPIPNIYIRKKTFPEGPPQNIAVTLEVQPTA